jgi:ATP-dependent Clp protease ATP-binding subunit ClpA
LLCIALSDGFRFRGEFEDRFKRLLEAVERDPRVILFIDEAHMLMGLGAAEVSETDSLFSFFFFLLLRRGRRTRRSC